VLEDAALDLLRKETLTEPDVAAIAKRLAPRAPQQPEGHSQGRASVTVTNS
jgi:hypothetical protein